MAGGRGSAVRCRDAVGATGSKGPPDIDPIAPDRHENSLVVVPQVRVNSRFRRQFLPPRMRPHASPSSQPGTGSPLTRSTAGLNNLDA